MDFLLVIVNLTVNEISSIGASSSIRMTDIVGWKTKLWLWLSKHSRWLMETFSWINLGFLVEVKNQSVCNSDRQIGILCPQIGCFNEYMRKNLFFLRGISEVLYGKRHLSQLMFQFFHCLCQNGSLFSNLWPSMWHKHLLKQIRLIFFFF